MKTLISKMTDENFLNGFILFKIKRFAILGLYSKYNHNKIKRVFHYLPVMFTILSKKD